MEERDEPPIENSLTREPDLYDHLLWQLHMADVAPRQREIAELIIGNLDPDGFLVASPEEIRAMGEQSDQVGEDRAYTLEEVLAALALIRALDPPGIACANLQESLLLQMDILEVPQDSLARRMIFEAWDLFLRRQFPAVAKKLGVELAELEAEVELVRTLETHPGRRFSTDRPHYIEPDVFVRRVGEEYIIQLNDDGLPRLRVSRAYRRMLQTMRSEGRQNEAQQFIKDKIRSAVWLIKSLDQRQRTIYKVAASIVRQQREFLDKGIENLRPMVLRDVAEDIGMHESTVSRVVSNKYIHTHRGLFPMKFFFHSGIDREYGDNISSLTVKRKIEQLIQAEDPKRPLSDSELMRILNREGIQIARRTVAKYRDELSIPSSTDRKQIF
jgi:RNA polymerase sigma-54 factor